MQVIVEYVEWHLTAKGWVRGTEHTEFGGTLSLDPPADRVLTYRRVFERPDGRNYTIDRLEEQWRCGDGGKIAELISRFGDVRRLATP